MAIIRTNPAQRRHDRPCFLVVSNDNKTTSVVKERLLRNSCDVVILDDLQLIESAFKRKRIDIALLDMGFRTPKHSAFDLYRQIRGFNDNTKICFLARFPINHKEFLKVFPSIQPDFVVNKNELMTSNELYDMFRAALH
jgi:response regulator RpfG family c-di-GMP phosphodiesterase